MPSLRWTQIGMCILLTCLPVPSHSLHGIWNTHSASSATGSDSPRPCPEEPRCECQTNKLITKKITDANCRNSNLTVVPTLPYNTYFLDLSINRIESLGENPFMNYSDLHTLNISHNYLTEILPGAFEGLSKLTYLSLAGNKIRYNSSGFHPLAFKPLMSLKHLNIQQNFTRNDFRGDDYNIKALSDLPHLESLSLDGIPDKNLSNALMYMPILKNIYFSTGWGKSRCLLPKLSRNFFPSNTSITNIILSFCEIREIEPKTFKPLSQLRYLDLSYNEELTFSSMKNISDGMETTRIDVLKLNKVHKTFGSCVEITKENLKGLSNTYLREIYLDSNRITLLQKQAVKYIPRSLEVVSLQDNSIMLGNYIAEFILQDFNNLLKVDISDQNRNHYFDFRKRRHTKTESALTSDKQTAYGEYAVQQNKVPVSFKNSNEFRASYMKRNIVKTKVNITRRHVTDIKTGQIDKILTVKDKQSDNELDDMLKQQIQRWDNGFPIPLPRNLRSLDASNMKVRLELRSKTLGKNKLRELYLNRNIYWAWYGPFKGFENLTKLDLSWNYCNDINLTIFNGMPSLKVLNLTLNYLDTPLNRDRKGVIFQNQGQLEILAISENKIRELPKNIFLGLKNLKMLFLARNLFKNFELDLSHMHKLERINLYDNQLETIDQSVRKFLDRQARAVNLTLNLERNNFKCDCTNVAFVKWIAESPVRFENKHNYICRFKDRSEGNLTYARDIYEKLEKECFNYTAIIIASTATLVLMVSLTATTIVYRYRWNLRYMYYMAKYKAKVPNRRGYDAINSSEGQIKDVNVSYADEDSSFIRHKIHTELEDKRGLKLYIRDRDAPIDDVSENIVDAIERSRKTLIIMSKDYLKHKWCIFEMNMVGVKALKTEEDLLCVLLLEDVPHKDLPLKIMKIIKDQQHIEYPGDENLQECFWDRLHAALVD